MTTWERILRYLILWGVLFALLCLVSVIRYWDELGAILAATVESYLSAILGFGVVIGLLIWGLRLLLTGR